MILAYMITSRIRDSFFILQLQLQNQEIFMLNANLQLQLPYFKTIKHTAVSRNFF